MKIFLQTIVLFSFLFSACKDRNGKNDLPVIVKLPPVNANDVPQKDAQSVFSYDLKNPDRQWQLPEDLVEVSGNSWVDNDHLILIEDQHPLLYLIRIDDKKATLEKTIAFEKNEKNKFDIEDVTIVDDVVYALWSQGTLFKIKNWKSKTDAEEMKTFLSKDNNTEGLCYDPVTKSLLIACKEESGLKDEKKSTKAVYQFNMEAKKLEEKPFLVIHEDDFEKLANEKVEFNPSAIAVHPVTHEIYLLSTQDNKCMAVFNRDGKLISFQSLDKDLMPQPEGICFSPEGKLYISSEGKKDEPGNLFEFDPKK